MEGNGVTITDDTRTAANMIVKVIINSLYVDKTHVVRRDNDNVAIQRTKLWYLGRFILT